MTTAYHSDALPAGQTALRTAAAGLSGGVLALAAWFVLHRISLPAFNTSMVTRGLATASSFVFVGLAAVLAGDEGEDIAQGRHVDVEGEGCDKRQDD